ncbi:MAG: cytochrome c oxidase accessory protein CcoG [Proteobacteria bacterium]|nr:cytochrome c oxidase accessory protein CcoG [Pseudomonadota bacterium]
MSRLVQIRSSLRPDGKHEPIVPADVSGRFTRARRVVFFVLIWIYAALPWVHIGGHPAVFLDLETRHFYLFGGIFDARDVWMMTFLLTGLVFTLLVVTALLGRAWCGWACPQTVFVDGVYRRIERLFQGSREVHRRRDAGPWTASRILRKIGTHAGYAIVSLLLANVAISYFVSLPRLFQMMQRSPAEHAEAFGVMAVFAGLLYFDLGWFREQFCVVMCPYGRLQSVLLDQDSLVIGYDEKRGEPRGKLHAEGAGDCVDCNRCVAVCPTGIDIRNGLQLDCIACTACVDACDEIMDRTKRPRGLVRYDSQRGLGGGKTRLLRPRLALYALLLAAGGGAAAFAFSRHADIEAVLTRLPGAPFSVDGDQVQNSFELLVTNKRSHAMPLRVEGEAPAGAQFILPQGSVTLAPLEQMHRPLFVRVPRGATGTAAEVRLRVLDDHGSVVARATAPFLSPPPVAP